MSMPYLLTGVALMALVTYLPRMIPLTFLKRKIENQFLRSFLEYVPYAVLAAMTFPAILSSTGGLISALFGLGAALLLAYQGRGLITVALGSSAVVFVVEQVIRLLF